MINGSLSVASQMTNAMQIIQGCHCGLSIVQKQCMVAQGADFFAISAALCCYRNWRVPSDIMCGNSGASSAHCAVVCA